MKDFLKIGDSEYRVEANWNAIAGFCRKKGVSDLSQLDVLVHIAIDDILPLMHCCIKESGWKNVISRCRNLNWEVLSIQQ